MKASNFIEKIESFGQKKWILWGVWSIYTLMIIALCSIHEPWGDEHNVWSMVYRLSFPELWNAMRGEGHFCLWHLCVWPWVNIIGMDYHALYVASSILMSCAVWLLLFKLEFSFVGKLFIIFSSPFFYYFPVVARCYALIPLILIAIAIVYQKQKNPFLYCFLIGLLAHTHAYMEGMVGILWCLFAYYNVYIPYKEGETKRATKNAWASLITIVLVLLAFLQIMGGIVDAAEGTSVAMNRINHPTDWLLYVYKKHHIQIFTTLHQHISHLIPKIDLPITLFLYITIIVLLYKLWRTSENKSECIWITSVSIVWQIIFAINIYCMWFQRVYLLYLPILYILWIAYCNNKDIRAYTTYIVICFWLLNTPAQYDILQDVVEVYSYDVSAANKIESTMIQKERPVITYDTNCSSLLQTVTNPISEIETLNHILLKNYTDYRDFYMITSKKIDSIDLDAYHFEKLYSTIEGTNSFSDNGDGRKEVYLYSISKK